ncbi:MAG: integrase [Psychroserpens sp.]|jgi:integrase
MSNKFQFTKKALEEIFPESTRKRYRDQEVSGLILEVYPNGRKSFRVYKKLKGATSSTQVSLGSFPALTIDQARVKARDIINQIAIGLNPNEKSKVTQNHKVTLLEVYNTYINARDLTQNTIKGYNQIINSYLLAYQAKPLHKITEDEVTIIHSKITEGNYEFMRKPSAAQADLCMRLLRALFNFAKYEYRGFNKEFIYSDNPVKILSHLKSWHGIERKNTYIKPKQIQQFLTAIETKRNEYHLMGDFFGEGVCDFIEVALFTGLRKTELLTLPWTNVDIESKSFHISETKNGTPLELPVSKHLMSIFKRRKDKFPSVKYVFNADNAKGYIVEPKKVLKKVSDEAGISFTLHDLRRTYSTVAESKNIGTYSLKRLLNHKTRRDDVTAGYTILTPEELRDPAQKVENALLALGQLKSNKGMSEFDIENFIAELSRDQKKTLLKRLMIEIDF